MPSGLFVAVSGNENGPESVHGTTIIGNGLSTALLDQAVFCTAMQILASTRLENGDEIGLMPFISEDGSKNLYIVQPLQLCRHQPAADRAGKRGEAGKRCQAAVPVLLD